MLSSQLLYNLQEEIFFLNGWLLQLQESSKPILSMERGIRFALQAKKLLGDVKDMFTKNFYSLSKDDAKLLDESVNCQLDVKSSYYGEQLLTTLQKERNDLADKVFDEESKLKDYGWGIAIASFFIRLFSNTIYYQSAGNLYDSSIRIVNPMMEQTCISVLYKTTASIVIFFCERGFSAKIFQSRALLHNVYKGFEPSISFIAGFLGRFGFAKKSVVKHLSKINWVYKLMFASIGYTLIIDPSKLGLLYVAGSYVLDSLLNSGMNYVIDSAIHPNASNNNITVKRVWSLGSSFITTFLWNNMYPFTAALILPDELADRMFGSQITMGTAENLSRIVENHMEEKSTPESNENDPDFNFDM